jgi:Raf kinase inhibitor-like YbhB/YbcL family protein
MKRTALCAIILSIALALAGCASSPTPASPAAPPPQGNSSDGTLAPEPDATATPDIPTSNLALSSKVFEKDGTIPPLFTCTSDNVSPELTWQQAPLTTESFALIMLDPDANNFAHWVLFDIPSISTELPQGVTDVGVIGKNTTGQLGYFGPCPPAGETHHYLFTLYALDVPSLNLSAGAGYGDVEDAMAGHVVGIAQLTGTFKSQ